jgi:hypothetical protein
MTLKLSLEPNSEDTRSWTVPADYRSRNDAKTAVIELAFENGAIEFLRFRGKPPPEGYVVMLPEHHANKRKPDDTLPNGPDFKRQKTQEGFGQRPFNNGFNNGFNNRFNSGFNNGFNSGFVRGGFQGRPGQFGPQRGGIFRPNGFHNDFHVAPRLAHLAPSPPAPHPAYGNSTFNGFPSHGPQATHPGAHHSSPMTHTSPQPPHYAPVSAPQTAPYPGRFPSAVQHAPSLYQPHPHAQSAHPPSQFPYAQPQASHLHAQALSPPAPPLPVNHHSHPNVYQARNASHPSLNVPYQGSPPARYDGPSAPARYNGPQAAPSPYQASASFSPQHNAPPPTSYSSQSGRPTDPPYSSPTQAGYHSPAQPAYTSHSAPYPPQNAATGHSQGPYSHPPARHVPPRPHVQHPSHAQPYPQPAQQYPSQSYHLSQPHHLPQPHHSPQPHSQSQSPTEDHRVWQPGPGAARRDNGSATPTGYSSPVPRPSGTAASVPVVSSRSSSETPQPSTMSAREKLIGASIALSSHV